MRLTRLTLTERTVGTSTDRKRYHLSKPVRLKVRTPTDITIHHDGRQVVVTVETPREPAFDAPRSDDDGNPQTRSDA